MTTDANWTPRMTMPDGTVKVYVYTSAPWPDEVGGDDPNSFLVATITSRLSRDQDDRDQLETCKCDPFDRCDACHEAHQRLTGRRLSGVGHQRLGSG